MNSCFGIDSEEAYEVEEFNINEGSDQNEIQKVNPVKTLPIHDATSIEQGLRQSVTAVS
ncbi:hypothetical protein [Psychrobacter sp. M13]|uniref:hypothetical protein n=1 Tax=Psychrobacter sp. M13 TaxID=3067275 RepID=UPI00273BC604|nr:hypothetical protein [Psychrobacter sp. M13]WLP93610.1 hypothetical protein Q9G97_08380 [Psychrobacter sp. M13]